MRIPKLDVDGFTLLEMLIVLLIASVLFIFIIRNSADNTRRLSIEGQKSKIEERVQVTMTRLKYDMRYLGYDVNKTQGTNPYVTTASATVFAFVGDINNDGALETITYRANGSRVERAVSDQDAGQYRLLADNLDALTFEYYDVNGNTTGVLANIRKIKATLTFHSETVDTTSNPSSYNLLTVSEVFVPRNLLLL